MAITRYTKKEIVPKRDFSTALLVISELLIVFTIGWIIKSYGLFPQHSQSQVLSASSERGEIGAPTATPLPSPTVPLPSPTPAKLPKDVYTIAIIGDSMVDTMGDKLMYLSDALKEKYPDTKFNLYNYGKGGSNVEDAVKWLGEDFHYKDRNYPLLYQTNPDIIIVGSFAYNPFSPYDRDRHWLGLTHLVQEVQKITPEVYMLAEIAPLSGDFGRGPSGVNWDTIDAIVQAKHIREQLENAIGLSKTLNVPLIDAFTDSQKDGKVKKEYVDESDGIHPSAEGHEFIAHQIVEALKFQ